MKQLIEYIVSNIVNHPESVSVIAEATEDKDTTKYLIKVDPEDVGRVIGKQGKVIKSIRQLVRIAAIQKGTRAIVDLLEDETTKPTETATNE
ncbi:MAG: RNA-binding protein (Contains KH domain)-like protein [Candidatus Collierbacteria bacterium GW2011_GWC2_44_18]|uniref:RNA-binding protein KhpA n=1 Tax=Candidatus Collierbacteria bacterium GW2011_GWC2_44_18 TaxID=1618392 RepID=A0A0G1HQJ7_9BACT|nr:MAG: RNA-binding protein (Contains KH domain)-like protein [Microgenomates group bacterium GW2011_GWC1_44_10]KKT49436.1 MAG: RNA-binding protein (Contains KH domain)-like protein [Candidatus Collierbacteria bacterium GW2011_GWC2_44_18]